MRNRVMGNRMRIAVIGAGAVGGTIAALFDRAGHEVEVTARGEHASTMARDGLRLTGAWGAHTARVTVSPGKLERRPELAFVTTKANAADTAMRPDARLLTGVPVVVVQNGLESVVTASAELRDSAVIGGLALFAASFLSPGSVEVTTAGRTILGEAHGHGAIPTLFAERAMSAVMPVQSTDNFRGAQWTKLIINQVNAFPAMTGSSVQEVIAERPLRYLLTSGIREAVRVGLANRVRFETVQGLSHVTLRMIERSPTVLGQILPLLIARQMGSVPNPGSTLQSIRRGQATEIDYLNGAVVHAAHSAGVEAPINAEIVRLVHEVERSGEFFTSDAVVTALRR